MKFNKTDFIKLLQSRRNLNKDEQARLYQYITDHDFAVWAGNRQEMAGADHEYIKAFKAALLHKEYFVLNLEAAAHETNDTSGNTLPVNLMLIVNLYDKPDFKKNILNLHQNHPASSVLVKLQGQDPDHIAGTGPVINGNTLSAELFESDHIEHAFYKNIGKMQSQLSHISQADRMEKWAIYLYAKKYEHYHAQR